MDNRSNKTINPWLIVSYKLLHDIIFLLSTVFALLLIAEGIVPGFISAHLNTTKMAIIIFAVLGVIIYLGRKLKIKFEALQQMSKKWIIFLAIFSMLLIINSLLRFDWKEIIIIALATFLVFFYLYREIFPSVLKN